MQSSSSDPALQVLEEQVLGICERHKQGITNKAIYAEMDDDVKPAQRAAVYNKLLSKGRLRIAKKQVRAANGVVRDEVVYMFVSAADAAKFRGLDATDRLVFEVVEKGGEEGVSKRDLRIRTNVQNGTELKTILDRLMQRRLVNEIKSVQGANKRVYISAQFSPSLSHTGGPWYNDEQEYDTEFIQAMYAQTLAFMRKFPEVTIDQLTQYVDEIKISNEKLTPSDLSQLVRTMTYDGAVEQCPGPEEGVEYFRLVRDTPAVNHLTNVPCAWCPVYKSCVPGGVISPEKCLYMTEWLKDSIDW